jgi:hypothetical protein
LKNFSKKLAVAAIPAVMALSAPQAESKILLMSEEGWEVSFDGAANAFLMKQSSTGTATNQVGGNGVSVFQNEGAVIVQNTDGMGVVTGLLPNVWGMTLKAPTNNGLDMQARIGFYTHMQGSQEAFGNGLINLRETNFSVSGDFGTVLVGRGIGIAHRNAIVNDMLLFGVGGITGGSDQSNTSLGRIGLGYLYTDFHPQISYTTPAIGPLTVQVGIFDPSDVTSAGTADSSGTNAFASPDATEGDVPRVEFGINASQDIGGGNVALWLDGSYQYAEFASGAGAGQGLSGDALEGVDSYEFAFGTKVSFQGLAIVASGFKAMGVGMRGRHGPGGLDIAGKAFHSYGGYLQGTYDFGQGTNIGYSYGGNYRLQTGVEKSSTATAETNSQTLHSGMIWHNINDNLRVIAEGGFTEHSFHMGGSMEDSFGGVGAFFFW